MTRLFRIAAASGVLVLAAAFVGTASGEASPKSDARAINEGLSRAVAAGRITQKEATAHRAILRSARAAISRFSSSRRVTLARVLHLVAIQSGGFSRPRALALFAMLQTNTAYLSRYGVPPTGTRPSRLPVEW